MELAELSEDFNFNKLFAAIDDLTTSLRVFHMYILEIIK